MRTSTSAELMGWVMVLLGTLLAISAGRQAAGIFVDESGWTNVSATVVRTRVARVEARTQRTTFPESAPLKGGRTASYRVFQELVYFVKGSRYQASLEIGRFEDRAQAMAMVEELRQAGTRTEVWVSANDPTQVARHPQEREAGFGAITLFALLGMFSLQFGSGIIRSASRGPVARAGSGAGVQPAPVATH